MGYLKQTDSSNAALSILEDGLNNPVSGFSFIAGVEAPNHTYTGFAVAGYSGPVAHSNLGVYGLLIAGTVDGLQIASINTDSAPFDGTAVALLGAVGTEVWKLTIQTDTTPVILDSTTVLHPQPFFVPAPGGFSWEFFFATPPHWTAGKTYTFTVAP
jgi:hypothetical protein